MKVLECFVKVLEKTQTLHISRKKSKLLKIGLTTMVVRMNLTKAGLIVLRNK